nr:ATP synthase subunit I [Marinicella sp. W31]MDC2879125.1 ATP synthase subunit I [Marinicella sp. W31]
MDECTMIDLSALPLPVTMLAGFLGGFALGYAYFLAMRRTADLIVSQGHPVLALALTFGRLALLFVGFYLAVQAGWAALLVALAGVLVAKAVILRGTRRVSP